MIIRRHYGDFFTDQITSLQREITSLRNQLAATVQNPGSLISTIDIESAYLPNGTLHDPFGTNQPVDVNGHPIPPSPPGFWEKVAAALKPTLVVHGRWGGAPIVVSPYGRSAKNHWNEVSTVAVIGGGFVGYLILRGLLK